MRLVFLLSIGIVCQVSATSLAQSVKLKERTQTLESIFKQVETQTGKFTLYSNNELNMNRVVKLDRESFTLEELYRMILKGTNLEFVITPEYVVVRPARAGARDSVREMITVTGVVQDEKGEPMPGVTVVLKGTTTGVTTDVDGKFKMTIPEAKDNVLVFSFVGMKTREVAVKDTKALTVKMEEEVNEMDEVVVNGLFTQNRNSYTGSVTTIKSEDIMRVSSTNLLQALSVLTPGMRIMENNEQGSNPNHVPEIIIRGTSSISASGELGLNRPLIMLDGVEISLEQLYDLDMFDIDRVDILKDASATAIYGDKASNGVTFHHLPAFRPASPF